VLNLELFVFIAVIAAYLYLWKKSQNPLFTVCGIVSVIGMVFNIILIARKTKK